jgi:hypothetical protein
MEHQIADGLKKNGLKRKSPWLMFFFFDVRLNRRKLFCFVNGDVFETNGTGNIDGAIVGCVGIKCNLRRGLCVR